MEPTFFADIILPVPLPRLFTYQIPDEWKSQVDIGMRVVVPFGKKKFYSGIVYSLHDNEPQEYETKPIVSVLDHQPVVNEKQLNFWNWIAQYYMCTLGEVYKAALPSGLKLESETKVHYNVDWSSEEVLTKKENLVLEFLAEKKISTIQEVNANTELKNSLPVIKLLLDKGALFISERLKDGYKPKTKKLVQLSADYQQEQKLHNAFTELSRARKQLEVLMTFFTLIGGANERNYSKAIELKKGKCKGCGVEVHELCCICADCIKAGVTHKSLGLTCHRTKTNMEETVRLGEEATKVLNANSLEDIKKKGIWLPNWRKTLG